MIRFIAALDSQNGIADNHGIPWQGRLPTDVQYYRDKLKTADVLMGRGVYVELTKPYPGIRNYVATQSTIPLRPGFEPVQDARTFLQHFGGNIWNIGGAILFASTIDLADELYLTRIDHDFHCTKFFPEFETNFSLISSTPLQIENDLTFHFEVWERKRPHIDKGTSA